MRDRRAQILAMMTREELDNLEVDIERRILDYYRMYHRKEIDYDEYVLLKNRELRRAPTRYQKDVIRNPWKYDRDGKLK